MDSAIFNFLHSFAEQSSILDAIGIFCAKYLPYIILLLAAFYILFKENHWQTKIFSGIFVVLSTLLARGIFVQLLNKFFYRPRPFETIDFEPMITPLRDASFPSGHATLLFSLAFAIFIFNKKWGIWVSVLALINSLARIFVGIHWPTDILGGIVTGLISFLIIYLLLREPFKKLYRTNTQNTKQPI